MTNKERKAFWLLVGQRHLPGNETYQGSNDYCQPWRGTKNYGGYGRFAVTGSDGVKRYRSAHVVAWEEAHGPMPPGTMGCHTCDHPWCVNPWHVYPGTALNNATDARINRRIARCLARLDREQAEAQAPGLA